MKEGCIYLFAQKISSQISLQSDRSVIIRSLMVLSIVAMVTIGAKAQNTSVPQKFNYSTLVSDSLGNPLTHRQIAMRATMRTGSPTGTIMYQERDTSTTSKAGIFTVVIGGGSIIQGGFNNIPWASGAVYFQVEMDMHGGTSYSNMGAAQLVSYPYAFVSGNGIGTVSLDSTGKMVVTTADGSTVLSSAKSAWSTSGNSGTSNGYVGTNDNNDFILKRGGQEGLRLGANNTVLATGYLGAGGGITPLTAADINGALSLRDTAVSVSANFTLSVGNRSAFLVTSTAAPASAKCNFTNGTVIGQVLYVMVKSSGTSNGINFPTAGNNLRVPVSENITDGGTVTFMCNGLKWLQTSISTNL